MNDTPETDNVLPLNATQDEKPPQKADPVNFLCVSTTAVFRKNVENTEAAAEVGTRTMNLMISIQSEAINSTVINDITQATVSRLTEENGIPATSVADVIINNIMRLGWMSPQDFAQ